MAPNTTRNREAVVGLIAFLCLSGMAGIIFVVAEDDGFDRTDSDAEAFDWLEAVDVPDEHIPYFFNNNRELRERCLADKDCPFQESTKKSACWGYEKDCPHDDLMLYPHCFDENNPSFRGWMTRFNVSTPEEVYWKQADFGFVFENKKEWKTYCQPRKKGDSSLMCSNNCRFCKGSNIYMEFRRYSFDSSKNRFAEDIFEPDEIGGKCELDASGLREQGEHKSPLQSWYAELQHFSEVDFHPGKTMKGKKNCDIVVDKPTIVMKLDAGVNMYHHFCDFLNLYLSQHANNSFTTDVNIINWDTSYMKYGDLFSKTWEVFTDYPMRYLREFAGKRVCFKDILFPYLPRMRYGLFYNTPLIKGCRGTSLFRAFQQQILYRLNIEQEGPLRDKIRITLISRGTRYRNILNEDEIFEALSQVDGYEVNRVNYNHAMPFEQQIATSANSDIFMGMHGSGLTHLLFQPDWGAVFEIYNCDDVNCYQDLAHLRGLRYFTWEKIERLWQEDEGHHPTLGAHKKFTNYSFDVDEFLRIVANMADYVRKHPSFRAEKRRKYAKSSEADSDTQTERIQDSEEIEDVTSLNKDKTEL